MLASLAEASTSLDIGTLLVIATCVTALLGLFLLFAWMQDRIQALAWWGVAYLIGGSSEALWHLDALVSPPLPPGLGDVPLFLALGMIWSAARLFHGRQIRWAPMCAGAAVWLGACLLPAMPEWPTARIVVCSGIVAVYTFLIAVELGRERRKTLLRRWPALFVPTLHGAIFLFPLALVSLDVNKLGNGWIAVFAIEVVLYVVGAAFIVLLLAKDRTVHRYKIAAESDPLTGLLNRRGFFAAAGAMMARNKVSSSPVSIITFDLDRFKRINDRFGHTMGDAMLDLFAKVARKTMRTNDVLGRIGGEEFIAIITGKLSDACAAAERVRAAFEAAAVVPGDPQISVTVSVGIVCGLPDVSLDRLIACADAALYRAKADGRNRIECDQRMLTAADRQFDPGEMFLELPEMAAAEPIAVRVR
jgi:diguanylate cyclase (GGDEF)-like protein